jgi:acylpyruvate hydrolase
MYLVELAVIIGKAASNIRKLDAMAHVAGYALSLDMTARNVQVYYNYCQHVRSYI